MSQARQLPLPLALPVRAGRADFVQAPCNERALARIEAWPDWMRLILSGPAGSGKSHLAAIWSQISGAVVRDACDPGLLEDHGPLVVEDIEAAFGKPAAEENLFHLLNRPDQPLLLTASQAPGRLHPVLPDLASRLMALEHVALGRADEALLASLFVKHFDERQLIVSPDLITQLMRHIERTPDSVRNSVACLDAASLEAGRPIGWRFARSVLGFE